MRQPTTANEGNMTTRASFRFSSLYQLLLQSFCIGAASTHPCAALPHVRQLQLWHLW